MKASRYYILIASFFIAVFASDDQVRIANNYIDTFIEKATNETGGFIEPYKLEVLNHTFEREFGLLHFKGEARFHDGEIHGLSSLQRKGNATLIDLDDFLIIQCQLTFKKIHATYKGELLLNGKGPKISLDAKIGNSRVSMFLMAPPEGGNATLMSFTINSLKDIRVSIWGLGPMGWTASIISTFMLNAMEKSVAAAASKVIFLHFSNEIEKVPFPGLNKTADFY